MNLSHLSVSQSRRSYLSLAGFLNALSSTICGAWLSNHASVGSMLSHMTRECAITYNTLANRLHKSDVNCAKKKITLCCFRNLFSANFVYIHLSEHWSRYYILLFHINLFIFVVSYRTIASDVPDQPQELVGNKE